MITGNLAVRVFFILSALRKWPRNYEYEYENDKSHNIW